MLYKRHIKSLLSSLTYCLTLFFGIQISAQTSLEFDARIDAATVLGSVYSYYGASPGLRTSFSLTSVNQVYRKTSLLYGISYANSGFNRNANSLWWCGNSFDNLTPEETARLLENSNIELERISHISLPLGIRQKLKDGKKWTIYSQAILEPMVYFQTTFASYNDDFELVTKTERSDQPKNLQFAVGLAAGFERKLTDTWYAALRPSLRMHLTEANRSTELSIGNYRQVTGGVALTLGHSF